MGTMTATEVSSPESILLRSLTLLVARWSSPNLQRSVADTAGVNVDAADVSPLYVLGFRGPMRPGDLAEALHLSRPTISKQLARLDRAGMIVRDSDPADGRAAIVRLSPQGLQAHDRLVAEGIRMMRRALRDQPRAEAALFATQLAEFIAELSTTDSAGEPAADQPHP